VQLAVFAFNYRSLRKYHLASSPFASSLLVPRRISFSLSLPSFVYYPFFLISSSNSEAPSLICNHSEEITCHWLRNDKSERSRLENLASDPTARDFGESSLELLSVEASFNASNKKRDTFYVILKEYIQFFIILFITLIMFIIIVPQRIIKRNLNNL